MGKAGARHRLPLTLFCSAGLHSPPLLSTAAVPGLVAPITNGFAGVVPFPGGHPALETVYANGLMPYPGNLGGPLELRTVAGGRDGVSGTSMISCAFVPREQGGRMKGVSAEQMQAVGTEKGGKHRTLHPDVSGSMFGFSGAGGFFKSLSFSLLIRETGQITSLIS